LLAQYENFPETIHGAARFAYRSSIRKVEQAIFSALHQLNGKTYSINDITPFPSSKCEVSFEFGVAEGVTFDYLGDEELERFQKTIGQKALPMLDFFCVIRYHVAKEEKRIPLKFDYNFLRFIFYENEMELRVSHERGTQRISVEELIAFITMRINEELLRKQSKPLDLKYSRAL